ncbi:MAG: family 20 glycosylhydrolase [Clostridia bacterium]|nr:family 20 glycosylhydrolase [Clostridia bacterium]MBR6787930.1 family 20 glycosylhydrolase [Clostridia bacterium]
MFNQEQIALAKKAVERVTGIALPFDVQVTHSDVPGIYVKWQGNQAEIRADQVNSLARGYFMLSRAVKENKPEGEINQQRHFGSCGTMVDMSRNAVMKVERVKYHIDQLAALGMNMIMLYTEDTFTVPEYPAFGYLRGAYTMEEMKEIDDYAASLGVEVVPCIQTLAHLAQFLQWTCTSEISESQDILFIDEPATYDFIEAEIRAISSCVRTKRIHIGMDEAHGVGLGKYYAKHGPTDRFELLNRHLCRVVDICKKYELKPIMWSDMFFRLGSKTNAYCDKEAVIPQSVIDKMPDVALCYWDYYHMDPDIYDFMLTRHKQMCGETVFAGGVWTWSGFLPQVKRTEESMSVGLKVCAQHQVDTVLATMWGDDGAETNTLLAASMLPIFSEACWQGPDAAREDVIKAGECLTGVPRKVFEAWGDFYPSGQDSRPGKQLIWCDPMYPLLNIAQYDSFEQIIDRSQRAIETMKGCDTLECRYATLLFSICVQKAEWMRDFRNKYMENDRAWLQAADEKIDAMVENYAKLRDAHRALWERDNKRFGWEVLSLRYGGVMERLRDAQDEIKRYLNGEIACIEELHAEPKGFVKRSHNMYGRFSTPARDYWQLL